MIDPIKLIQGARAVYGESFDKLYNPILPISAERVCIVGEGDKLKI
ncbi:metal-dependent hydrolase (plasmid) [Bacillus thuringiensis serovar tolworthi]|uniref:Metal-dependent hydrolase n=1 Tax=Bacillus thuringiensis subsp. tolworthi TaxID=1442 RepID=A0A9W4EY33_BACTO|nr:metal-dependent hydrolase [Bacillus thuringiensis serovar tolworthi]